MPELQPAGNPPGGKHRQRRTEIRRRLQGHTRCCGELSASPHHDGTHQLLPEYGTHLATRMCQVAEQYQTCASPLHPIVPIGDNASPAGALIATIAECRKSNPTEADEIL